MHPDLTGRENIFLNGAILGIPRKIIKQKMDEIVHFSELEAFIDTPVKRYSSGMIVKLGFSIATSIDAEILIVDEVLAVGDIMFQQKCLERMEHIIKSDQRTVLIVGHNIRQLERICTRVILMDQGKITMDGNPSEVCSIFFHEAQERTLERQPQTQGIIVPELGAGVLSVIKIELFDADGLPAQKAALHEPLTVRISIECKKNLAKPEIIVGLHTSDFVQVLAVANVLTGNQPDLAIVKHVVECRLGDMPLMPGWYSLRLVVLDQHRQAVWSAENLMPLPVAAGKYDVTRLPEMGLVGVATAWAFDVG